MNVQANVDAIPNGWASGDKKNWIDSQTSTDWEAKKGEANTQIKLLDIIPLADKNDIANGKYTTWLQNNDNPVAIPDGWAGSSAKNDWIRSTTEAEWNTKKADVTAQMKVLELKPLANNRDTALANIDTWCTDENVNTMPDTWTVGTTAEEKRTWTKTQTVDTWNAKEKDAQTIIDDNMGKIFPFDFGMMAENWTKFGEFWIPPDGQGWADAFIKDEQVVMNNIITFVEQAIDASRYVVHMIDPEASKLHHWGWTVPKVIAVPIEVLVLFELKLILHEYLFKGVIEKPNTGSLWCGTAGIVFGIVVCSWMFALPAKAQGVVRIIFGVALLIIYLLGLYVKIREIIKFIGEGLEINTVFAFIELVWDFFTKVASVVSMVLVGWKNIKLDPTSKVTLTLTNGKINDGLIEGAETGTFSPLKDVTLVANVPAGKKFTKWQLKGTTNTPEGIPPNKETKPKAPYTVQPSDTTIEIEAGLSDLPKMALTIGGTPNPSGDIVDDNDASNLLGQTQPCYEGQVVKIKAKDRSADGKGLKAWKITSTPAKGKFGKPKAVETTFTMPKPIAAVNIEAEFENLDYTLKLTGGKITTDPNKEKTTAKYNKDASVGVISNPPTGKQFSAWTVDPTGLAAFNTGTDAQNVTMPAGNVTLTASFTDKEHTVTVTGGKVGGQASKAIKYNQTAPIKADAPATGQQFKEWTGDTDGLKSTTKAETSIKIPDLTAGAAINITATYENILYNFSVKGGKIKGGTHNNKTSAKLAYNEQVTVAATVPAKKEIATWKITPTEANLANPTQEEATVTMPAENVKVEATFNDIMYDLRVTGGKIKGGPSNGQTSGSFKEGDSVSVTATVPRDKVIDTWEITTTPVPTGARLSSPKKATARVKIGAGNINIRAKFKNR